MNHEETEEYPISNSLWKVRLKWINQHHKGEKVAKEEKTISFLRQYSIILTIK